MAIRDLLWACPLCGTEGGLRPAGKREICHGCGARFRRGRGASIVAEAPDGTTHVRSAAEWADRLPEIAEYLESLEPRGPDGALLRARARARTATGESVIRYGSIFMNRIERFGPAREGALALYRGRVRFTPDAGEAEEWTFDEITAVQPSSSTLQIKARRRPVVSFRFPEDSARFWEEVLCAALRRHYRAAGRGEIIEFQPRIATR